MTTKRRLPSSCESNKPVVALAFKLGGRSIWSVDLHPGISGIPFQRRSHRQRPQRKKNQGWKGCPDARGSNGRHRNHFAGVHRGAFWNRLCFRRYLCGVPVSTLTMTSMFVPDPVISLAIVPKDNKSQMNMSKALNRFSKEDPTFRTYVDDETNETIIEGMGELHLEVYVERMRREYTAEVTTGKPRVAYRETITQRAEFDYTHKKQTGGSGQYGRVAGYMEPVSGEHFVFENNIVGGKIPTQFIPSCEKGFRQCMAKGPKMEFPVTGVKVVINDGASHSVDSSEMAFIAAARGAFREGYLKSAGYS